MDDLAKQIETALATARSLAPEGQRTRALTLTITSLETAQAWLEEARTATQSGQERSEEYGKIAREAAGISDKPITPERRNPTTPSR